MTELAVVRDEQPLALRMEEAQALAASSLLPEHYRGKPANVMLAVGLGAAMGLSPAESLYRIAVIKGKPAASAELIAANVRKAGHTLRVRTEPGPKVTATIIRADDRDFEHTVVRDLAWAQAMGLDKEPNYRKQPETMLQWRAITAVARLACSEALYGVAYVPDELYEQTRPTVTAEHVPAADRMRAALQTSGPETPATPDTPPSRGERESVDSGPEPDPFDQPLNTSGTRAKRMFALFGDAGVTEREGRLAYVSDVVGREVASSGDMTVGDCEAVIVALEADQRQAGDAS